MVIDRRKYFENIPSCQQNLLQQENPKQKCIRPYTDKYRRVEVQYEMKFLKWTEYIKYETKQAEKS